MIRAVLDPSVLIAALLSSRGAPAELLLLWIDGAFELIVSPGLLLELETVLLRPKFRAHVALDEVDGYLDLLARLAISIEDPLEVPPMTKDPKDDYLFALAHAAKAAALVSGDRHVLEVDDPLVRTPRDFLTLIT